MDLRKIKKLMEMVEASTLSELEVRSGDESVRIVRPLVGSAPAGGGGQHAPSSAAAGTSARAEGHPVRAPMAGTFYVAPEPGDPPFVAPGQAVEVGDVLCIIESMKMMNEIKAERRGVCSAICVVNGQAVGAGEILFRIA